MKKISLLLLATLIVGCSNNNSSNNGQISTNTDSTSSENTVPSLPTTSEDEQTTSGGEQTTSQPTTSDGTTINSDTTPSSGTSETSNDSSSENNEELPSEVEKYYQNVDLTLTGDSLKNELYEKIKGHTTFSYSSLGNMMKETDRDWNLSPNPTDSNPYMNLIYATYNGSTSSAKKHNTVNSVWDKEHIWAKSHGDFGTSQGAGSDLHHLRASDKKNNNGRSSFDFGNVDKISKEILDYNGKKSGKLGTQNGFSGTKDPKVYEPLDSYKGDVARAVFYMATRYSVGNPTLSLVNELTERTSSPGKLGIVSVLLSWNKLDPVDEFEFNRNGLVQKHQKNRNPFIDHQNLADKIWG